MDFLDFTPRSSGDINVAADINQLMSNMLALASGKIWAATSTDQNVARADRRSNTFYPTAAHAVILGSDYKSGDIVCLINTSTAYALTAKSSALNSVVTFYNYSCVFQAKQDSPTLSSHWGIIGCTSQKPKKLYTLSGSQITSSTPGWSLVSAFATVEYLPDGTYLVSGELQASISAATNPVWKLLGCNTVTSFGTFAQFTGTASYTQNNGSDIDFAGNMLSGATVSAQWNLRVTALPSWAT